MKVYDEDQKGLSVHGLVYGTNVQGVSLNGLGAIYDGKVDGAVISGLVSNVGTLEGFSYGTVGNYATRNGTFAMQVGLKNKVREYEDGFVLQVGLLNQIGKRMYPFVHIKGFGSLFKKDEERKENIGALESIGTIAKESSLENKVVNV